MSINNRIREALRLKDITHEQVAELLSLNRASVSHQLRAADTDSIKLLVAVKKLTNARYQWLISGELPMDPDEEESISDRLEKLEEALLKKTQVETHKPTPAERKNDTEEWIKNNLNDVTMFLLDNPELLRSLNDQLELGEGIIDVVKKVEKAIPKKKIPAPPTTGRTIKKTR